ncbi:unnamed protein product, partial [Rotaria sordida]
MATVAFQREETHIQNNDNNLESFSLLWLHDQVNTTEENQQAQKQLRQIINHLKTFDNEDHCQQYILSISSQDRIIFIVNDRLAVTVKLDDLISQIKQDKKTRTKVEEPLSFNVYSIHENIDQSTTELNGHFVHSLLLIDVLLRMKTIQQDKEQFISLCNNQYEGNLAQLAMIHEFDEQYTSEKALWWYSRDSFLYKILNKALRTQNIDILFLFRFVIADIYQQLKQNQCQSFVQVYRGQVMFKEEVETLKISIGKFVSINSFVSTSLDRELALFFLTDASPSNDLERVLFEIDADPQFVISKPFADISKFSDFSNEEEILFMIGCIFRLIDIHQNNNKIWVIRMELRSDDEHDLKNLFEHMKKQYGGENNEVNLLLFGEVLRQMGKYDLAEKFFHRLSNELPSNDSSLSDLYYSLGLIMKDKSDYDSSLQWLHKSLEIKMHTNPSDYINISRIFNCIGVNHWRKDDDNEALIWYNKGIELFKQAHDENHPSVAHFYNNVAVVYQNQKKYLEALNFYEKSVSIDEKHLPSNHPDIGTSHNNIGEIHRCLGHYDLALEHYNRCLQIGLKSLPPHHPDIANSYENLGLLHEDKNELTQALLYLEKAATIYRQSLPSEHPD